MNYSEAKAYQISFLKKIEEILPNSSSLVYELSELLQISTDSAYRRMRGDTALSIYEVMLLCNHFHIQFDSTQRKGNGKVTFNYVNMDRTAESFQRYLKSMLFTLKSIHNAPVQYIKYASEDVPIFYNYKYRALSGFKMFYWMKSIMNITELEGVKYSLEKVPEEFVVIGKEIAQCYFNVPSIEIWTDTTLRSTIKQVEYYMESGQFESEEVFQQVCFDLKEEIIDIQKQASIESKQLESIQPQKNYTLYYSDIEITNNCVVVGIGDRKSVFLGHQSFNTIETSNTEYCGETEIWIDNLIRKSTLISGVSEKLRYKFFNNMFEEIDALMNRYGV